MAVTTETNRTAELATDGSETDFDFDMTIYDESELLVFFKATGGSYAQLTLNTDYGVIFSEYGGTVSTSGYTAPLVAGSILIIRHLDITQDTDWLENDNHSGQQHQDDFDRLVIRLLQIQEQLDRCMSFAIHSATKDIELPEPEANLVLGWNAGANGIENKTPDAIGLVTTLDGLADVDVGSPSAGDMMQFNGSVWVKVSKPSGSVFEFIKDGNVQGSNGNAQLTISGNFLILEARVNDVWVDTGNYWRIVPT